MRASIHGLLVGFLISISFVTCAKEKEPEKPAPVFKSSTPANNATDVSLNSSIELIFDEVVTLNPDVEITINNKAAQVEAKFTKLVFTEDLASETEYVIHVPKGAVINSFDVPLQDEIVLEFSTEKDLFMEKDPNFYIFLCFGQSNMEGQGDIETQDKTVDSRFQVLQALTCSDLGYTKGQWRTAVPPLCQCYSGLSPADYFGRTMVEQLPDSIKIGVINVAVGGCDIRLFDKDLYADYDSTYTDPWFTEKIKAYGGNPYAHLMELAKLAQKSGVIKGILLHQGETNTGDEQWPEYVKKVYTDMLNELNLDAENTPLLAGETVHEDQGNVCCASMNAIIATLPSVVPNAHIISSAGCTAKDNAHFNSAGYRELGRRYAETMLSLLKN